MSAPVLYTFRRCPYAMRARLAIYESGARCEIREILLKDKPQGMLEASPKGTVPVLIDGGRVIDESWDVMLWAYERSDPWERCAPLLTDRDDLLALIARNDGPFKHHLDRYKNAARFESADAVAHRSAGLAILEDLAQRVGAAGRLYGAAWSLADFAIAPFVRQFRIADPDWFDAEAPIPVRDWLGAFLALPLFERIMEKRAPWRAGDAPVFTS